MIISNKEIDYIVHDTDNVRGFYDTYGWASNFFNCAIFLDGNFFPTTENGYMYSKLDLRCKNEKWTCEIDGESFNHAKLLERFQTIKPNAAKKLGRKIPLRPDWDEVKYDIMSAVVFDKFYRHMDLRLALLASGNKYFEETNHWNDTYWGVCNGVGANNLGRIIMDVRSYWASKYPELLAKPIPTKVF